VQLVQPDEICNPAAQRHVAVPFATPEYAANADTLGTLRNLEAFRILIAFLPGVDVWDVGQGAAVEQSPLHGKVGRIAAFERQLRSV
jgi:GDP-mannose 4,6 dehydratase